LRKRVELDVVVVVKEEGDSPMQFHGIVVTNSFKSDVISRLRKYSVYCDYTWVVVPDAGEVFKQSSKSQLGNVGIMVTDGELIRVEEPASHTKARYRGLLAMNLLEQLLPR
jgi:hypothetical protein